MTDIEMREFDRPDIDVSHAEIEETALDLPNVPVDVSDTKAELSKTSFVSDVRRNLNVVRDVDPSIYRRLTFDTEGNVYYNHKRLTQKRGRGLKLLSIKTLNKSPDSREFLRLIGYTQQEAKPTTTTILTARESDTVAPEQTAAMKAKADSFKLTEDWAKREKEKAIKQLKQTTDESERKRLQESIQEFEQMEIQARRRYYEIAENQLSRMNSVIHDETRSLGERLRELFRRDGLTIGAVITAIGMTISTIILALSPKSPSPTGPGKPRNLVKQALVKLANILLDLAKKALSSLPGVVGSMVSFLFKKAGELVLFLSQHLLVLFLFIAVGVFEFIINIARAKR